MVETQKRSRRRRRLQEVDRQRWSENAGDKEATRQEERHAKGQSMLERQETEVEGERSGMQGENQRRRPGEKRLKLGWTTGTKKAIETVLLTITLTEGMVVDAFAPSHVLQVWWVGVTGD